MTRVVAALSGGGAKAAAHVGAVRALAEAGLAPARYTGTSMGAVIAAGFCAGLTADDVLARMVEAGNRGIARRLLAPFGGIFVKALMRPEPLRRGIETYLPARRFGDLRLPLTVTAVDLDSGELVLFGDGGSDAPLLDALMASCALPVFFPPVIIGGRRLADGGLRGVVPLEPALAGQPELVVAVDIGPGFDELGSAPSPYPSLLRAHNEATGILMAANSALEVARWEQDPSRPRLLYIRPRVEKNATFRMDHARRYADEGYRATAAALREGGLG
ncbi:MAG TPA: patatin-like phospholipase family protein [Gemmatimonadales bacterium]|jgi:NTE family protein|nr:patatin-like phospholipase family protein [Gemmatimonadales bacterium]